MLCVQQRFPAVTFWGARLQSIWQETYERDFPRIPSVLRKEKAEAGWFERIAESATVLIQTLLVSAWYPHSWEKIVDISERKNQ